MLAFTLTKFFSLIQTRKHSTTLANWNKEDLVLLWVLLTLMISFVPNFEQNTINTFIKPIIHFFQEDMIRMLVLTLMKFFFLISNLFLFPFYGLTLLQSKSSSFYFQEVMIRMPFTLTKFFSLIQTRKHSTT